VGAGDIERDSNKGIRRLLSGMDFVLRIAMIKLGPEAEAMVKEREGYKKALPDGRCTTYYCPAGKLTIGWG
jgi:hypothetical protein